MREIDISVSVSIEMQLQLAFFLISTSEGKRQNNQKGKKLNHPLAL